MTTRAPFFWGVTPRDAFASGAGLCPAVPDIPSIASVVYAGRDTEELEVTDG